MPVRTAQPYDAPEMAAVHVAAWQQGYRGLLPDTLLDTLSIEQRKERWEHTIGEGSSTVLVSYDDRGITGLLAYGASRDDDENRAACEVYSLNVHPDAWRRGHGAALMEAALEQLRAAGYAGVSLWVLDGNERAFRSYERMGFAPDGTSKVEHHPSGAEFRDLRYRRAL